MTTPLGIKEWVEVTEAQELELQRHRQYIYELETQVADRPDLEGQLLRAELTAARMPGLEAEAAARVQAHLRRLGAGGENWVAEGVPRIADDTCPFCGQDLQGSPVIPHYQAYFSEAYTALKTAIVNQGKATGAVLRT